MDTNSQKDNSRALIDLDDLLGSLLDFTKRVVMTIYELARHPTRFSEDIKSEQIEKRYSKPFTSLLLINFLLVVGLKNLITYQLNHWIKIIHKHVPVVGRVDNLEIRTVLEQLTLLDLLLIGIPVAIVVTVLSTLLCFLMTTHFKRYYRSFIQIGCYSVAFQGVVVLALIFVILGITFFPIETLWKIYLYLAVIMLTPALILWPGYLYSRIVTRLLQNDTMRVKWKRLSRFLNLSGALAICTMTLAINLYFVIPQMPASIAQIVDSHMEAVILHDQTIAGQTKGDSEGETLSVLLSNPNKFQCILKASTFRHLKGHEDNPEQACYKIIDHYPKPRSLIFISPDESVLIHGDKIDCPDKRDAPIQQPQDKIDEDLSETIERIELEFIMSNGINYHMQADVNHEQAPTANLGQSEG